MKDKKFGTLILDGTFKIAFYYDFNENIHYMKIANITGYLKMQSSTFYSSLTIPRNECIKSYKYDDVNKTFKDTFFYKKEPGTLINVINVEALYYDLLGFLQSNSDADCDKNNVKVLLNVLSDKYSNEIFVRNNIILSLLGIVKPNKEINNLRSKLQDKIAHIYHEYTVIRGMQQRHLNDIDSFNDLANQYDSLYDNHQKLIKQYHSLLKLTNDQTEKIDHYINDTSK